MRTSWATPFPWRVYARTQKKCPHWSKWRCKPKDVKQVRALMGGISYYRKVLPDLPKRLRPINSLLLKGVKFLFTPAMEKLVREILAVVLPTPSSAPSRGGGQSNLPTLTVAQEDCGLFCFILFVIHVFLSSLCYSFSARHFLPSRDCWVCHLSVSCWFSPFFV